MRRPAASLFLSFCVGCGPAPTPEAPAEPPTFDLLAWEYPGARPIARIDPVLVATDKFGREEIATGPKEGTRIKAPALYAYDTPRPVRVGLRLLRPEARHRPEYKPADLGYKEDGWDSTTRFDYDKRDAYPTLRLTYTGLEGRHDVVKTATLVGPGGAGFSVVVVLSRARPEGSTTVELVVTRGR